MTFSAGFFGYSPLGPEPRFQRLLQSVENDVSLVEVLNCLQAPRSAAKESDMPVTAVHYPPSLPCGECPSLSEGKASI
jgi:hypothetical protein